MLPDFNIAIFALRPAMAAEVLETMPTKAPPIFTADDWTGLNLGAILVVRLCRIPSWTGTEGSSLANSMDRVRNVCLFPPITETRGKGLAGSAGALCCRN
jgi:hypothetical protein